MQVARVPAVAQEEMQGAAWEKSPPSAMDVYPPRTNRLEDTRASGMMGGSAPNETRFDSSRSHE